MVFQAIAGTQVIPEQVHQAIAVTQDILVRVGLAATLVTQGIAVLEV